MRINREIFDKHVKLFSPGKVIFEEGDPGEEMYVVIQGEVEIRKKTSADTAKTLAVLHTGDIFGEMALIENKKRSASAIATQPTRLLVLNEALFDKMIETNPDFAKKMIRILSERIRKANSIIENIMSTNKSNQLLEGLYQYAKENGISTFKGYRVNIETFADWASKHLGIEKKEILSMIQTFLKRGIVKYSAVGKEEILVEPRS